MVKISVIIRTYNTASFVGRAIDSVLKQNVHSKNYEILVVDDGSTDNTEEVLKNYYGKIRIIKLRHTGKYVKVLNTGIARARGEFIVILDADDLLPPESLGQMLKAVKKDKRIGLVYGDYYEVNIKKTTAKLWSLKNNIFESVAGGILINKRLVVEAGYYDDQLVFPEYDLLIKLLKIKKIKSAYLPLPLYIYNRQPASVTADKGLVRLGIKQLKDKYGISFPIRKY